MTAGGESGDARMIGQYRLVRRIGSGGMGVVHLATDPRGQQVALKVLRTQLDADAKARLRLAREFSTLSWIRHPGIAEVLDADVEADPPYLVTRFVPGDTLESRVHAQGPLPPGEVIDLGIELADALNAIHAAGVVHRDVKPPNVMLVPDGGPVLIDFGIAHVVDEIRLTMTGLVMGTPGYLSPEIYAGNAVTTAADWWGWGATLTFAVTGRQPFGQGPIEAVMERARCGQVDVEGVPEPLRSALRAACTVKPADRPTGDDLAGLLLGGVGGGAAAPSVRTGGDGQGGTGGDSSRSGPSDGQGMAGADPAAPAAPAPAPPAPAPAPPAPAPEPPAPAPEPPAPAPTTPAAPAQTVQVSPPEPGHWQEPVSPVWTPAGQVTTPYGGSYGDRPGAPIGPPGAGDTLVHPDPSGAGHPDVREHPGYPGAYPAGAAYPGYPAPAVVGYPAPPAPPGYPAVPVYPAYPAPAVAGYPVAPAPRAAPGGPADLAGRRPPASPPGRPAPTIGVTTCLLAVAAAGVAIMPVLAASVVAVGLTVLRVVYRSEAALLARRHHRGRRPNDVVAVLPGLVWRVPAGLVSTLAALVIPVLLGGGVVVAAAALRTGVSSSPRASVDWSTFDLTRSDALFLGAVLALLASWWGPGGTAVRRGARTVLRSTVHTGTGVTVVVCALLAVLVAEALLLNQGVQFWTPWSAPVVPSTW